jgi:uncharacterized protein
MTLAELEAVAAEVVRRHGAHTVILYGSQARGDANEHSDVDLVAIRKEGAPDRDVDPWRGWRIDLHLYAEADILRVAVERAAGLLDARVLVERDGWGRRVLDAAHRRLAEPPPAESDGEHEALWAWGDKMRLRVRQADPTLAALQRSVLLAGAPEVWCRVRRRWYCGPKAALAMLSVEEPATLATFRAALAPGASVEGLDRLLDALFPREARPAPRASRGGA